MQKYIIVFSTNSSQELAERVSEKMRDYAPHGSAVVVYVGTALNYYQPMVLREDSCR